MRTRPLPALLIASCLSLPLFLPPAAIEAADKIGGHFSATADVDTVSGTRSMGFDIIVSRPLSAAQVQPYKAALANGGQQALLAMLRQSSNGMFSLGGLQYPINLIVAERGADAVLYIVATARNFNYEEATQSADSADFPFAVLVFTVPDFGSGDGKVYPKAALAIGAEGQVQVRGYKDRAGVLKDVKSVE